MTKPYSEIEQTRKKYKIIKQFGETQIDEGFIAEIIYRNPPNLHMIF